MAGGAIARRWAITFGALFGLATAMASSARADTLYIHEGPDSGELQISAPWGDYVVYDQGGGEYWVGTQREYDRARATAIAQEHHMMLSSLQNLYDGRLRHRLGRDRSRTGLRRSG
jgi:hypothetical protein